MINEFGFSHECMDVTPKSTTGTSMNRLEFDDVLFFYSIDDEENFANEETPYGENIIEFVQNPYWRGFSIKGYYIHN